MNTTQPTGFGAFFWRLAATHTITYFIVGILALNILHYREAFVSGELGRLMRPTDSPIVALGPALQLVRGLIFAFALWPFRSVFLSGNQSWLKLWMLFVGLAILSTFGPAFGSVDGLIYTMVPPAQQLLFLPELLIQSCLLSFLFCYWYRRPRKAYNMLSIVLVVLILFMSIAGYLAAG